MKMAIKIFVGLVFTCIAISLAMVTANSGDPRIRNYLGEKVIDVRGRVFDHATNQGIPNAFVIVELFTWSGEPFTGHGASGCNGGEVVRTDSEGNYHFTWDWQKEYGEEPPDDVSVHLKAFATGWEYYPTTLRRGGGWQSTDLEGPDFVMTEDEATFDERLAFVRQLNDNACDHGPRRQSFLAYYEAQHEEIWSAICKPLLGSDAQMSGEQFMVLEGKSINTRSFASELIRQSKSSTDRDNRRLDLQALGREALPEYQRAGPNWAYPFPSVAALSSAQARLACDIYSPSNIRQWVSP